MPGISFSAIPIGIPWCRKENYAAFRSIFEDSNDLPDVWEDFIRTAEKAEHDFKERGNVVFRVDIDPGTFPNWCQSKGYRINSKARHRFAAEIALRKVDRSG